jgi:glyoxylate reductase
MSGKTQVQDGGGNRGRSGFRVFVAYPIPESGLKLLEGFDVGVWGKESIPTKQELIDGAEGCDAVITLLAMRVDDDLLARLPKLKLVAQYAVGYDNVDVAACTRRGITVSNTPGVLTETTADMAWALLMAAARRIGEGDKLVRNGGWRVAWAPLFMQGVDVFGKTLGIVGMGRIGLAVAKRAQGFGMKILYYSPDANAEADALGAKQASLDFLLKHSDFVSIHCALTDETRGLIGERELALMKPTAVLVNTARGAIVDEKALAHALKKHALFAAGLDVFEKEPLPADSPLLKLDNVVLAPHAASSSRETRDAMAVIAAQNVIDFFEGRKPRSIVNPDAWKK